MLGRELKRSSFPAEIRKVAVGQGPGNAVLLAARYGQARGLFSSIGVKGRRSEAVAQEAVAEWRAFDALQVPVQKELADQLLLPLALAGKGVFRTGPLSSHARTNLSIIELFLGKGCLAIARQGASVRVEGRPRQA